MQFGLLHQMLAVAIETLIASNLFHVLHQHDFDAITYCTKISRCKRLPMVDAIGTSHQNFFDAINPFASNFCDARGKWWSMQ
jgi:predicted adenine nucleotide alpha hydrolase (AANH) superfamily ATPase